MVKITFEISKESYDLLFKIKEERYVEYRDTKFKTLEDFLKSDNVINRTEESFLARNGDGTLYLIPELLEYNLIECDSDAWHSTYRLTKFGKEVTKGKM